MTIERGQPWGEPGGLPAGGVLVRSDAEARAVVERARRAGDPVPALGLLGGDLCRTMGGTGDEARLHQHRRRCDARSTSGAVLIDGRMHWFVAHLVARRSWWRGRVVAAMNAEFLGSWDVAPRSHPNDGRLDLFDVSMSTGDRWKARHRLAGQEPTCPTPTSPSSAPRRCSSSSPPRSTSGSTARSLGRAHDLSIRVEPDALICVV